MEDIKSKCCYVKFTLPAKKSEVTEELKILENSIENDVFTFESKHDLQYPINHQVTVNIPAKAR